MPHVPSAPPGTRFFARVDRFHCECPSCGVLIVAHAELGVVGPLKNRPTFKRRRHTAWNPISSTLKCPSCHKTFGVGLVLWPMSRGPRTRIPPDHQPTRRQLRELAQYAYGRWAEQVKKHGEELNLAIDQECRCQPPGWNPYCPVHGWEVTQAGLEEPGPVPPVEYDEGEEPGD